MVRIISDKVYRGSIKGNKPGKRAVLDSLLAILSPSIPIFEMINLTLGHESKSCLSLLLLLQLLPRRFIITSSIQFSISHNNCV